MAMTEAEWLACTDPTTMLEFLWSKASDRKLRLIACASVRRIWDDYIAEEGRRAVEVMERFADGWATEDERREAESRALEAARSSWRTGFARHVADGDAMVAAVGSAVATMGIVSIPERRAGTWISGTDIEGCRILRDV